MLGLFIATVITIITGYFIIKKYKPQPVLMIVGLLMMLIAAYVVGKPLLVGKASTNLYTFDAVKFMSQLFSTRTAGLGMIIMSAGGFAKYMDHIGASKTLVNLCTKPLQMVKSPYVVLALAYIIGQILNIFIPSASGLGMLLMVTIFPILTSLGVSRLSAAAVICSCSGLDLGPASGNSNLAAKNAGLDPAIYFAEYQIPLAIVVVLITAALHLVVQRYFDKKDAALLAEQEAAYEAKADNGQAAPFIFAFLPMLPLALILIFSKLFIASIKMDVVTAMLISLLVSMFFQLVRTGDLKGVLKSMQVFFDGMGSQFAAVITLIVAGEVFAKGLTSLGAISKLIDMAHNTGMAGLGMTIVMTAIIVVCSIVMGSANAPFFAFAALVPQVATKIGMSPVIMLLPMQFASGLARNLSPITGVVVAVCGLAGVNPMDLMKRTYIPMSISIVITVIATVMIFH
ncbi:MAG: C4-dicarboxylate transporter DcuC [Phascolarctobacterium sp.]